MHGSTMGHKSYGKQNTHCMNGTYSLNYIKNKDGKIYNVSRHIAISGAATGSGSAASKPGAVA